MLRISRLTDYAFILLTELSQAEEDVISGSSLADRTPLPLPTVRKVLKTLAQADVLESHQGAHGGYGLARPADEVSVADIVSAMEGSISVTLCCDDDEECEIEGVCPTSESWKIINEAIQTRLESLTLTDVQQGASSPRLQAMVGSNEATGDAAPSRRSKP
jgi:FeS assembly SUF system regulator